MRIQTAAAEHAAFEEAAEQFAADHDSAGPIKAMMMLALHAERLPIRRWAATWLNKNCDILVVFAEDGDRRHATPPEAANLR